MKGRAACPRCGGEVRPPGVWSSRWSCRIHGDVYPLQPITAPSARLARQLGERSAIPLWLSWPMPRGWVVGAILHSGDEVSGVRATGGVGLGARFAGVEGADPGAAVQQEPHAKLEVESRPVPLWWVDCPGDRAVYVGQWRGRWLWAVLRPQSAGVMLVEDLPIADLRDLGHEADLLPYGTPPPWLTREAPR